MNNISPPLQYNKFLFPYLSLSFFSFSPCFWWKAISTEFWDICDVYLKQKKKNSVRKSQGLFSVSEERSCIISYVFGWSEICSLGPKILVILIPFLNFCVEKTCSFLIGEWVRICCFFRWNFSFKHSIQRMPC